METLQLQIPAPLLRRIEARAGETGFASPAEYVLFVLGEVMADDEGAAEAPLTADEEQDLTDRLRGLGYIE
jgi:hypothetical protein